MSCCERQTESAGALAIDGGSEDATFRGARSERLLDAGFGLVAVALTLALGELTAAIGQWSGGLSPSSAPLTALGNAFISITPEWLTAWAIRSFGIHDKQVLLAGVFVTLAAVAVIIGLSHRRRFRSTTVLVAVLVVVTLAAVWSRSDTRPLDGLPTLLGSAFGLSVLMASRRRTREDGSDRPGAAVDRSPARQRRVVLRYLLVSATAAALSGVIARLIPTTRDVEASRSRIRIGRSDPTTPAAPSGATDPAPTTGVASSASGRTPTSASTPSKDGTETAVPTTEMPTTPALSTTATTTTTVQPFSAVTGLTPFITPNHDFYRIDTTLSPPLLRAEDWSLRIHGRVAREIRLDYQQLSALPRIDRTITLGCVSNFVGGALIGNAVWTGVRLDDLLAGAGPMLGADCVLSTSIDGFTCSTPLGALIDGRDALLAIGMNGEPLPIEHGFPVRMIVPGLYGYASATKWVVDLEVTAFADVTAYWTARGYGRTGLVKIASRIDVPAPYTPVAPGDLVTIAGAAWAQHTGIADVQIQVDSGPWTSTELDIATSADTWRLWRYRWTATAGRHTVVCRAIDRQGGIQDPTPHDPLPDGATGYAELIITVT